MKATTNKENATAIQHSRSLFAKNQEAEQPFFAPSISRAIGGDYHTPRKSFFQAKPQPSIQTKQATLKQMSSQSLSAVNQTQVTPMFAGIPIDMAAPGGITYIASRSSGGTLGAVAGLTLRKSAAAFTIPNFQTTNRHQRVNGVNQHFATVQVTHSADAIHESFYPGPGDHEMPSPTAQTGTQRNRNYYRISPALSDLIRRGEQEHLDDVLRAYELTYGVITSTINQMNQRGEFGPASTPHAAFQLAEQELTRLLPQILGVQPSNWFIILERLLDMTDRRDQQGWHNLSTGSPVTQGNSIIYPLQQESTFNVGQVPSSQVVNYP